MRATAAPAETAPSEARAALPRRQSFRPDIEGLRAVAILLVVAYHARVPGFSGGFIGVDVFFVVSGYLITGLLVGEVEATGRLRFLSFYARRARRLVPAAALVLVVTLVVWVRIASPLELHDVAAAGAAAALYVSNFWFLGRSTNYFDAGTDRNPFLHTWSLGVEEQFYLVWPLLLALAMRVVARQRRRLAIVLAVTGVASFGLCLWLTGVARPWGFFASPARWWEFAAGGGAFLIAQDATRLRGLRRLAPAAAAAGVVVVIVSALVLDQASPFPGPTALLPVAGTVAILLAGATGSVVGVLGTLGTPVMQWVGRRSYSWYLWHWPVLVAARVRWGTPSPVEGLALAALALGLSAITYALVENPVRYSRLLVPRPALSLALGLCVVALAAGGAEAARSHADTSAAAPTQAMFTRARADVPRSDKLGCTRDYFVTAIDPVCSFGAAGATTTVALFGDSHSVELFPTMERLTNERGWHLVMLTKSECPSIDLGSVFIDKLGRDYHECRTWRDAALARLVALRPRLVVLVNSSFYVKDPKFGVSLDQWMSGLDATARRLTAAGIHVVLVRDTPRPGFDVPVCLSTAAVRHAPASSCAFPLAGALSEPAWRVEQSTLRRMAGTATVDLTSSICGSRTCDVVRGSSVLYRDTNHLTASFAASLAPQLEPTLLSALGSSFR